DIVCSARSPEAIAPATAEIVALLRERHRIGPEGEDDFNIRHPEEVVKAQLESSETFSTLLSTVAAVALLVGGIGIMNVMLGRRRRGRGALSGGVGAATTKRVRILARSETMDRDARRRAAPRRLPAP